MQWETAFAISNVWAMLGWLALAFAPRTPRVLAAVRFVVVGALCAAYAVLVAVYLGRVEGAGFMSLAGVKALLASDPVLVAGWLHYLAFDLVAGQWIAERADREGLSRLVQVPFLATTLMLGPVGLLAFFLLLAWRHRTA